MMTRSAIDFEAPYGDSGACGVSSVTWSTSGVPNTPALEEKTSRSTPDASIPSSSVTVPADVAAVGLQGAVDGHPGVLERRRDGRHRRRRAPSPPPPRPGRRRTRAPGARRAQRTTRRRWRGRRARRRPDRSRSVRVPRVSRCIRRPRSPTRWSCEGPPGQSLVGLDIARPRPLDDVVGQRRRRLPDRRSQPALR